MFFDGPTGSGKSLIADMVAQKMGVRALMCTADRALQDQYVHDFAEVGARTIKGRRNYTPQISSIWDKFEKKDIPVTCDDCNFKGDAGCSFCPEPDGCSYRMAKDSAKKAPLAVLNYSYLLNEANGPKPTFSEQSLIIADECDVLESILLGIAEVNYSDRMRRELDLGQPHKLDDETGEAWIEWLTDIVAPALKDELITTRAREAGIKKDRRINMLMNKIDETEYLIRTMSETPDGDNVNWVLTGYNYSTGRKPKTGPMVFKPIRVGEYGDTIMWRHGRKFLLMSATIVSPDELADSLGYRGTYGVVTAPMPFEVERRKIYYIPVARLTRKTEEEATPKIAAAVVRLLDEWEGERAIVHTVSYKLTEVMKSAIMRGTDRPLFTYDGADEKEKVITEFENTPNAVLIGPSIGRGTDFKGDKARINIVCKMPFASLGDKQIKARVYVEGGQRWYTTKAVRELVQACGRTTRNESDWGITYILDASVGGVLRDRRSLFPRWWREALDRTIKPSQLLDSKPLPRPLISELGNTHA